MSERRCSALHIESGHTSWKAVLKAFDETDGIARLVGSYVLDVEFFKDVWGARQVTGSIETYIPRRGFARALINAAANELRVLAACRNEPLDHVVILDRNGRVLSGTYVRQGYKPFTESVLAKTYFPSPRHVRKG